MMYEIQNVSMLLSLCYVCSGNYYCNFLLKAGENVYVHVGYNIRIILSPFYFFLVIFTSMNIKNSLAFMITKSKNHNNDDNDVDCDDRHRGDLI